MSKVIKANGVLTINGKEVLGAGTIIGEVYKDPKTKHVFSDGTVSVGFQVVGTIQSDTFWSELMWWDYESTHPNVTEPEPTWEATNE